MTAPDLLSALAGRGVVARIEGGNLKLRPAQSLDAALLEQVRANKTALLDLLAAPQGLEVREPEPAPRSILAGDVYNPALASAYARRASRMKRITQEQRDQLLAYADMHMQ